MKISLSSSLQSLIWIQLFLYILLPGGGIFGINLKIFFIFVFFCAIIPYLITRNFPLNFYVKALFLILFTSFYLLVGFLPSSRSANGFIEARLFFITLFMPLMVYYLLNQKSLDPKDLLMFIVWVHMAFIFIKIVAFILVFNEVLDQNDIENIIRNVFDVKVMTLEVLPNVTRIQLNLDLLTIVVFPLVLFQRKLNLHLKQPIIFIFHSLLILNILVSFSRYLIASYFVILLIFLVFTIRDLKTFLVITILVCFIGFYTYDIVYQLVELRFSDNTSSYSDYVRKIQSEAIISSFYKNPYFGNGFGGYTKEVIRDPDLLFSYELQLLSLLMKFGIIGTTFLLIVFTSFIYPLLRIKDFALKFIFSTTYLLWIVANFFNPYLFSSLASVIFVFFVGLGAFLTNGEKDSDQEPALI